jgi:hypothetical protein
MGRLQQTALRPFTAAERQDLERIAKATPRTRTWCPTGTALRTRKTGPVQVVDSRTADKKDLSEHADRLAEQ